MAYPTSHLWRRRFAIMWRICLRPNGWAQGTVAEAAEFVWQKLPFFNQLDAIDRAHADVVSYWMLLDAVSGMEISSSEGPCPRNEKIAAKKERM